MRSKSSGSSCGASGSGTSAKPPGESAAMPEPIQAFRSCVRSGSAVKDIVWRLDSPDVGAVSVGGGRECLVRLLAG